MAERHVEALFAPAYDGLLDDAQRRRFDVHLETCDRCVTAFADHCAAGDALRSLPAARMPVPVRLPSHAPRSAHRSLRERLGLQSGGRLVLLGAGAAAAAVVVGSLVLHSAQQHNRTTSEAVVSFSGAGTSSGENSSASSSASIHAGAAGPQFGAVAPDTAFTNAVTVQRSGRSGEVLVLATTQQAYAAGATVQVDARLVLWPASAASPPSAPQPGTQGKGPAAPPAPRLVLTPDVALAPVLAEPVVSLLLPTSSSSAATGGSPNQTPIATASPAGAAGFFQLTIPATARSGDVLTIVATVPAGLPSTADALPVSAVLQITVA